MWILGGKAVRQTPAHLVGNKTGNNPNGFVGFPYLWRFNEVAFGLVQMCPTNIKYIWEVHSPRQDHILNSA